MSYQTWAAFKEQLIEQGKRPAYREGQVWRASLGSNIGHEVHGRGQYFWRPVVVVRGFKGSCLCVPMSTRGKNSHYRVPVMLNNKERYCLTSQVRTIDTKRLIQYVGALESADLTNVREAIVRLLRPER